jgi:hypothetical protein
MHLATILIFVGAGFGAYKAYEWWKKKNPPLTGGDAFGRPTGEIGQTVAAQQAAHDDVGSGDPTNPYDAVIGVADIIGGVIHTGIGSATGEVADDTVDVVDQAATARSEGG